jgi:ribosomal protein S18 acetylase RimI-like enzyme
VDRTQKRLAPGPDGAEIRPANAADGAGLRDFFARLSVRTRVLRFFAPLTPTAAMLRSLAGEPASVDAVVAVRGGVIIGHGMAVDQDRPSADPATDIGVVVADAWQSQGVGSALIRTLMSRAQARGVTSLQMDVLHDNHRVRSMIASHWTEMRTDFSADCVTIQVPLPQHRPQAA